MGFNRKLVSKATWSTWQVNDVQHPFGTTAKIGVLRISPLYKLLARLGPSHQKKIMNKTNIKGTFNSETQKLFQISDCFADVCLEKRNSILCLFSILGHKFHDVLWVDLSCIEKNVLSWAHLQKMAGAEQLDFKPKALWTLKKGSWGPPIPDGSHLFWYSLWISVHLESWENMLMLRLLKKLCKILKVHGWLFWSYVFVAHF